jgi:hypothetical protein
LFIGKALGNYDDTEKNIKNPRLKAETFSESQRCNHKYLIFPFPDLYGNAQENMKLGEH